MTVQIPSQADAVIIGGGIVGCSVAYHLAKLGWSVLLLERQQLTCGTTWHAAGLLPRLRASKSMTDLVNYGHDLYLALEKETGINIGYKKRGALSVALSPERMREFRRAVSTAKAFGAPAEEVSAADIARYYPGLSTDGIIGGIWLPMTPKVIRSISPSLWRRRRDLPAQRLWKASPSNRSCRKMGASPA